MATITISSTSSSSSFPLTFSYPPLPNPNFSLLLSRTRFSTNLFASSSSSSPQLCVNSEPLIIIDKSAIVIEEATSLDLDQLWAAACLRIRTFNHFNHHSISIEDHKKYLAEREFEALNERVGGKREGFRRVTCINASIPLSHLSSSSGDLCAKCKFSGDGGPRVVIGSLDLNQCLRLPDEIIGMKPQGIGADFARAYISNVCVAEELHRNGLGFQLVSKAKSVATEWGITDLYVHVAVDNEAAKMLYTKCGFTHESDEPAWQARFLNRPRRIIMWFGLPVQYNM